jgi:hypothetical protein
VDGSGRGITVRYYPGICQEGLRKKTKTQVRIAGLWAQILTQKLPNMKKEC